MSLKELINGQDIMIDDHKRGAKEIKNWDSDDDIHIDKTTQYKVEGKLQAVQIKIPLNSNKKISVEAKTKINEVPRKLKKEIVKAFENKNQREYFIKDLLKILKNFESTIDNLDKVQEAMSRVAKHFDLNSWTEQEIKHDIGKTLKSVARLYKDEENNNEYYIIIDRERIRLGELSTSWKELLESNANGFMN